MEITSCGYRLLFGWLELSFACLKIFDFLLDQFDVGGVLLFEQLPDQMVFEVCTLEGLLVELRCFCQLIWNRLVLRL
jgi:hypothetical protein